MVLLVQGWQSGLQGEGYEMSEIPEDVMRAVGELLGPPDERMNRSAYNALSLGIARAILRA